MRKEWHGLSMLAAIAAGCSSTEPMGVAAPRTVAITRPPVAATTEDAPKTRTVSQTEATVAAEPRAENQKTEAQWKQELTPEQYRVLRQKGTERAFSGKYWNQKADGTYTCAGCGEELFASSTKFDSGCGWPSFYDAMAGGKIKTEEDTSLGMRRIEVMCAKCGGHLGHVFEDAPEMPTGLRYCINSASLQFVASPSETKPPAN